MCATLYFASVAKRFLNMKTRPVMTVKIRKLATNAGGVNRLLV